MGKRDSGKDKAVSKHKRKKKRSGSRSSSSSSSSSIDEQTKKKLKKKIKKLREKEKHKKKEKKALKKLMKSKLKEEILSDSKTQGPSTASCDVDISLMEKSKSLAPMTKEEWEKQQNTFKRVYDEETGRMRLVKGTGEIVEECVRRERHLAINKQATKGDGEFFQRKLLQKIKEMTLTVHGFPSDVAALRFEWAWQHPTKSRRLKSVISKKKHSESSFEYCLKVMFTMLRVSPWCRLPLTVRWLSADVMVDPPPNLTPPMHMPIVYGPVISKKLKSPKKKRKGSAVAVAEDEDLHICKLCLDLINSRDSLVCLSDECKVRWHILCLAAHFVERESSFIGTQTAGSEPRHVLPVEGCCPECGSVMLWGDLIRKKKGCYSNLSKSEDDLIDDAFLNSLS